MTTQPKSRRLLYQPATYRVRVSGRLGQEWSERLQGMKVSILEQQGDEATSELTGLLPDQAALMGVLQHLYNCSIVLLGVECVGD